MAYQLNPMEFKSIINEIIDANINVYSNKREADTLLLNSSERNEDNEDILARIEDYTTKIDRLQSFMQKCEPLYGKAFNSKYTSSAFLKEFCKKCASEYDEESITVDNFFGDLMFIAIEQYLQLKARNTSTITPQSKVVTLLVSRNTTLSFTGTQTPDKYNILSQTPEIAPIYRDSDNPWIIHIDGVKSGATNIVIEDTENEVSLQVPVVVKPSTLYCPAEVKLVETTSKSFEVSSNIDPIEISGLILKDGQYVEQTYEENGETHHPFDEFKLSRVNNTITVKGLKPTVTPTDIVCSIYDKSQKINVKVIPCSLILSAHNVNIRSGKKQNVNLQLNVDIENLSYEIKDLVNEDIIDIVITEIASNNYNIEVRGKKTGHCIVTFNCGSQTADLDVFVTERT